MLVEVLIFFAVIILIVLVVDWLESELDKRYPPRK